MKKIDLKTLQTALAGSAAAFRSRVRLQPAGGEGDKVFPPTYAGAVYATEERRVKQGEESVKIPCVLLDSVQSQANRLEEALQQAIDSGRLDNCPIPLIEVDFSGEEYLDQIGRITSLEAPHRVADAILRDSLLSDRPFRQSEIGEMLDHVSLKNATALYRICPTALIFGVWDSTGRRGGLGPKFQRTLVSEIVGVNVAYGKKTNSRIDPLGIQRAAGPIYRTPDGDWTLNPEDALMEKEKPVLYGKREGKNVAHDPKKETFPDEGRPSVANHGNVLPDFDSYTANVKIPDPLRPGDEVRQNRIRSSGVTIDYAEQTIVLSLPALRRLRFPVNDGRPTTEIDLAGRVVLAALALTSVALAAENGYDLRSRCLLWPEEELRWELLERPGSNPVEFEMDADTAIRTLEEAVAAAEEAGLEWDREPLQLRPAPQLIALLRRSQELGAAGEGDGD